MPWVRSEYAGELAVASAWVSALMPWSVTVLQPADSAFRFVIVRYAYFHLQFLLNLTLPGEETFLWIHEAREFVGPDVRPALSVAIAAAAVFTLALALSVAYYGAEERVESLPVDPVRVMGALLGATGLAYLPALALLWRNKAGLTVPVGPLFLLGFAALLLRVERT